MIGPFLRSRRKPILYLRTKVHIIKEDFWQKQTDTMSDYKDVLTEEQIELFQEAFSSLDKECSGIIPSKELATLMRDHGDGDNDAREHERDSALLTEEEISDMIDELGSDTMSFEDFANLMALKIGGSDVEQEKQLREAFMVFDRNGTGITAVELSHVMTNLGESITQEEAEEMIDEVSTDGRLSVDQFVTMMLNE